MFAINGKLLPGCALCLGLLVTFAAAQNASEESGSASWKPLQPQKRQAVVKLDTLGSAAAKSYDPPPEFYRGPGSSTKSTSKLDSQAAGFISKPIGSLPPVGGVHSQISSLNDNLSEAYDKWRLGGGSLQDRISVGGPYGGSGSAGKSYAYDSHPYPYDYGPSHGYEPGHAQGHAGYSSSGEAGVPYHVYRPRPEHGHYQGASVDYGYSPYQVDSHEIVAHKGSPELSPKALLAKSFLIPLASATVLGIAAALVSNPLLLQLAPVPGIGVGVGVGAPVVGKRRRRRRAEQRTQRQGKL
ncbi:prisilkin-39 [Drosophila kikkawai]|uniref:Prisilkin-39 n=1 Tax=Drosophila kikkawai TaxID=30033 RepID=A0ABM4GFQ4_DROKI